MKTAIKHDEVMTVIAHLALAVRAFEQQLDDLDADVARLRASWTGEALGAYDRAHHQWMTATRTMKDLLAESTRRLISANAISMETSTAAARIWS